MEKSPERCFYIEGGHRIGGELRIQGAKNSALPVLTAAFLAGGVSEIHNCPDLTDVDAAIRILRHLGCMVIRDPAGVVTVDASVPKACSVPDDMMREMRSSIVFLGAILARCGSARLTYPGGCELGARPVDLHLAALKKMGASIREDHGHLDCTVPGRLRGARIALAFPSVGATENVMLAASLAEGETVLTNAAREPEILDLANFLNACGAKIRGAGEGTLVIEGVERLYGGCHHVIGDRIAAATYLACSAVTGGKLRIVGIDPGFLAAMLPIFEEMGCAVDTGADAVTLMAPERLRAARYIRTMPYPGFPTDAQAPLMAMSCVAEGHTVFVENIFENRYRHVAGLARMGARIKVEGRVAVVDGVQSLQGASVISPDLRGGAALVVAGVCAGGVTELLGLHHIYRGYEGMEQVLGTLGAKIRAEEPAENDRGCPTAAV